MKLPFFKVEKKPQADRPDSGKVIITGKINNISKLEKELKSMSVFNQVKKEHDKLIAIIVESTDRNKNPYKYNQLTFEKDSAELFFTIPPEVPNPTIRQLDVTKTFFSILSLLEIKEVFLPNHKELYEKTMEAFELRESFADNDSLRMKYDLDKNIAENSKFKEELSKLKKEKESLNHELLGLEKKCQLLENRLSKLENLTDNEIDQLIIKWTEEHNGSLNEKKFCDSYSIPPQRLEERLDSLAKRGVIRIV